jgi:phosphoglycolate phosphatase-like HAD superfamily hydrolase
MNILFDFDGTICDSLETVISIANPILHRQKKPLLTLSNVRNTGLLSLFSQYNIPRFQLFFLVLRARHLASKHINSMPLFPGMDTLLRALHTEGHTLGIVSSNSKQNINRFLKVHDLTPTISFVSSSPGYLAKDKTLKTILRLHGFLPKNTIYIGDETRDIRAAASVSISSVSVTWGYESKQLLSKANPDYIVSKPSGISALLNRL